MNERYYTALAAGALTGLSALVVWLVNVVGWEMPPAVAATIAGIIVSIGLAIRKYGIKGLVTIAWKGEEKDADESRDA